MGRAGHLLPLFPEFTGHHTRVLHFFSRLECSLSLVLVCTLTGLQCMPDPAPHVPRLSHCWTLMSAGGRTSQHGLSRFPLSHLSYTRNIPELPSPGKSISDALDSDFPEFSRVSTSVSLSPSRHCLLPFGQWRCSSLRIFTKHHFCFLLL